MFCSVPCAALTISLLSQFMIPVSPDGDLVHKKRVIKVEPSKPLHAKEKHATSYGTSWHRRKRHAKVNNETKHRSSSLFHHCKLEREQLVFEVLPGLGWDNLRNVEMSRVLEVDYTNCQLTNDFKYLIPADMHVIPLKASELNTLAEKISHFKDYNVVDAKSVNREITGPIKGVNMGGGFANEKKKAKQDQMDHKSTMLRTTLRDRRYQIVVQPDASKLTRPFRRRLMEVADHLIQSLGKINSYVEYLSQCIIRDFGTHYIDSMDAGALLTRVQHISNKEHMQRDEISTAHRESASFTFFISFSYSKQSSSNSSKVNNYQENLSSSYVVALGGPPFGPGTSIEGWQLEIDNNLVAIDRRGKYLYTLVNKYYFPDLPPIIVYKLQEAIKNATFTYIRANTLSGCLDFNNKNFDPNALLNDPSRCEESNELSGYQIGGNYYSLPDDRREKIDYRNPATGSLSCPKGSDSRVLDHGIHWCVRDYKKELLKGYMFGGIFSKKYKVKNPLTNGFSCPQKYIPFTFTAHVHICYTKDTGRSVVKLGFGGFFSCRHGNPMAQNSMGCAAGFRRILAFSDEACSVYYCAKIMDLQKLGKQDDIKLPPFTKLNKESALKYLKVKALNLGIDHHWLNVDGQWFSKRGNGDYLLK
jgi:hypothetical protein